jgi:hypothetical protein
VTAQLVGYRETVPPDGTTGALVALAVTMAARELGIPRPTIRYFDADHGNHIPGFTKPAFFDAALRIGQRLLGMCSPGGGHVHVADDLRQAAAIETAAHECFHGYARHNPHLFGDADDEEAAADVYAARFAERFYGRR